MSSLYSINSHHHGLGEYDLAHVSSELSRRASNLFLPEGIASALEIRDYVLENAEVSTSSHLCRAVGAHGYRTPPIEKTIKAEDELSAYLKVGSRQSR